jgi:hypothetical protein
MSREDSAFPLGSLVLVSKGRHAGSVFAVVGTERNEGSNGPVLIADGRYISARRPKRKNPRHIVSSGVIADEVAARAAKGKCIDDGWLAEAISHRKLEMSRLILEEVGQSVCRKTTS